MLETLSGLFACYATDKMTLLRWYLQHGSCSVLTNGNLESTAGTSTDSQAVCGRTELLEEDDEEIMCGSEHIQ